MATILITAATGQLGVATVTTLLDQGVPASSIAVAVRDPSKAESQGWEEKGISIRQADYSASADVWAKALEGIERVLLISSSNLTEAGARVKEHKNVIDAFKNAASTLTLIAYTSIYGADKTKMIMGEDHRITEEAIKVTKVPYIFLRNGWYTSSST